MQDSDSDPAPPPSIYESRAQDGDRGRAGASDLFSSEPSLGASSIQLSDRESRFICARDGFYLATAAKGGWPDLRCRDGPPGFVKVLDDRSIIFREVGGQPSVSARGDPPPDDWASLLFIDYRRRRRLWLHGRLRFLSVTDASSLASILFLEGYSTTDRVGLVEVENFEWAYPERMAARFTGPDITPLMELISALKDENRELRRQIRGACPEG